MAVAGQVQESDPSWRTDLAILEIDKGAIPALLLVARVSATNLANNDLAFDCASDSARPSWKDHIRSCVRRSGSGRGFGFLQQCHSSVFLCGESLRRESRTVPDVRGGNESRGTLHLRPVGRDLEGVVRPRGSFGTPRW
jgi:hypothetical protein